MKLTTKFDFLGGAPVEWDNPKIKVKGLNSSGAEVLASKAAAIAGNDPELVDQDHVATSAGALGEAIDYVPNFEVNWSVSFDDGAIWHTAGTTKSPVYVLLGAPTAGTTLYETVVDIAVKHALGESDALTAINGIWGYFAGRSVARVDGTELRYDHTQPIQTTMAQLLATGRGQCTAWTELFSTTLTAHGITGATDTTIDNGGRQFQVNPMPAQGSQGANYTPDVFGNHHVIRLNGAIYDPSYGSWAGSDIAWEDTNLLRFANPFWQDNTVGTLDLIFNP